MSAVLSLNREAATMSDLNAVHFKMVYFVKRAGGSKSALRLAHEIGQNLVEEMTASGESIRNDDELRIGLQELDDLLGDVARKILKGNIAEIEKEQQRHRDQLPRFLVAALTALGWIIWYPRASAFRQLKRVVEGL